MSHVCLDCIEFRSIALDYPMALPILQFQYIA